MSQSTVSTSIPDAQPDSFREFFRPDSLPDSQSHSLAIPDSQSLSGPQVHSSESSDSQSPEIPDSQDSQDFQESSKAFPTS